MTPKEKAKDLFDKMQLDWACDSCHNDWAKECALIAVDNILDFMFLSENENSFWINYYNIVKKEILAL